MRHRSAKLVPRRLVFAQSLVILALIASGCATQSNNPQAGAAAEEDFHDPWENVNRKIFDFNQVVDRNVIAPAAKGYRAALPEPVRDMVHDFLNNLNEPLNFANATLQGRLGYAKDAFVRFLLNSTIGMAGFVDVAGRWGIPYRDNDLGITFGVWGIPEGPYLVAPILGPSDPRDLAGIGIQAFGDPWNRITSGEPWTLYWIPYLRGALIALDQRSRYLDTLADIERTSLDYYATIRSLYRQRRAALVRGEHGNLPPNPAFTQNAPGEPAASPGSRSQASLASARQNGVEVSRQ
ncbi:MAG: VacJ family lipoprotein [Alphaproteobacteria bacterium]|nr:VacJ family lipoprotein [Alphaproteobacteria bacterium]